MYTPVSINRNIVCLELQLHIVEQLKEKYPAYWLDILSAAHASVAIHNRPCVVIFFDPATHHQIECPDFILDLTKSDLRMSLDMKPTFDDDHVTRDNIAVFVEPRK